MMKRTMIHFTFAALLLAFASGCIVINVSRTDDKKAGQETKHEEVVVEEDR